MTTTSCRPVYVFFRCRNMGSTLSAPWAYLQKHGWPWIGIPASLEIFLSCSVKDLEERVRRASSLPCAGVQTQPNAVPGGRGRSRRPGQSGARASTRGKGAG